MHFFNGIKNLAVLEGGVQKSPKPPKLDQTIRHAPKIARTSNLIADSKSSSTGLNMNIWLSCCNMPWEKVTAFLTAHTGCWNSENNRFKAVFLCTLKITALFLKNFHLHLDCYTLVCLFDLKSVSFLNSFLFLFWKTTNVVRKCANLPRDCLAGTILRVFRVFLLASPED